MSEKLTKKDLHTLELIEVQKELMNSNRKMPKEKWDEVSQAVMNNARYEVDDVAQRRHDNIVRMGDFPNMPKDFREATKAARERATSLLSLPKATLSTLDRSATSYMNTFSIAEREAMAEGFDRDIAFKKANEAIKIAKHNQFMNSLYTQNEGIMDNINNSYMGHILDPYEAQILFETTALGYQGVIVPVQEGFSTTLGIVSKNLSFADIEGIKRYLVEKGIMWLVRMAIIDSQVYGGSVLSPVFNYKGKPIFLRDLRGDITRYFGLDGIELDTLMCFDRYCFVPYVRNDGLYGANMYMTRFKSSLPIPLGTIFDDGIIDERWIARFSTETTSNCKLLRPDNFGVSVFARAAKAVYNYEQQIQFLNYALGQLSIVVFNSKSQDYLTGGSGDHTWNSGLGGNQLNEVKAQLSAMQQSMNIERGIYLNDVEVSALNRSFQGVADIIGALKEQAGLAFGLRQDLLFGIIKSSLGYKEDTRVTPYTLKQREIQRSPITKALKWCVFGYFAEKKWIKQYDNGKTRKWDVESFQEMLDSIDVFYNDTIKTNEDILKESGAMDIMKLVEARLIKMSSAINFLSDIPILNKAYENDSKDYVDWANSVDGLQRIGIIADAVEQQAITKINQAILAKQDALAPTTAVQEQEKMQLQQAQEAKQESSQNDETSKNRSNLTENKQNNETIGYNVMDAGQKVLADFGEVDEWGVVNPRSVDKRRTRKEVTQKLRKLKSHE